MANWPRLIMAGLVRYAKKSINLTAALAIVFFLMFFFIVLFDALGANMKSYWVDRVLGGDYAVSNRESYVDIMKPVNPDNYFQASEFYASNPRLETRSAPRLRFGAMAEAQDRDDNFENMLMLVGIDAAKERGLLDCIEIEEGDYFSGAMDEIILPEAIASSVGVRLGQTLVLAAPTASGFLNMEPARLVGIQKTEGTAFIFGYYQAFVPLELAQALAGTDKVSEVVLRSGAIGPFNWLRGKYLLVPALKSFGLSRAVEIAYGFLRLMIVLFLGVFAFGIVYQNVVMMNGERKGEIGVYLAYGASPRWLALLMYGELAAYTFFCSALGALAGLAAFWGLNRLGLYPIDTVTEVMLGGDKLVLWPGAGAWATAFSLLLALVLASASVPIWKAAGSGDIVKMFRKD